METNTKLYPYNDSKKHQHVTKEHQTKIMFQMAYCVLAVPGESAFKDGDV